MLAIYFASYNVDSRVNCEQLACEDMRMKMLRSFFILFLLIWLQACTSVSGPVHFYPGDPRNTSEIARLSAPSTIVVTKIDGKEVEVPFVDGGFYEIHLLPGVHRINFMYEQYWGGNLDSMLIKSDVVGVESEFFSGMNYEFTYPVPRGVDEASEMSSQFKAKLLETNTGRQIESRSIAELNDLNKPGSATSNNAVTIQPGVNPVPMAASTGSVMVPAGISADASVTEDAVKRMKFWWLMADEEERESFKQWMKSAEQQEQ